MLKRLFTLLAFAAFIVNVSAQTECRKADLSKTPVRLGASVAAPAIPEKVITAGEGQAWWGYFNPHDTVQTLGLAADTKTFSQAMWASGKKTVTKNKTINAIRVFFWRKERLKDVAVWLTKDLKDPIDSAAVVYVKVDSNDIKAYPTPTDVALPTPYTITSDGIYVGYTFTVTDKVDQFDSSPIVTSFKEDEVDNATFLDYPGFGWMNFSGFGSGNLAISALLSGGINENSAAINDFDDCKVVQGDTLDLPIQITDYGYAPIKSVAYTITTNGVASDEQTVTLDEPFDVYGHKASLTIKMPSSTEPDFAQKGVTITKVNGVDNAASAKQKLSTAGLITVSENAPHRTVMENFTMIDNGFSPEGIVAMNKLDKLYPDNFIGIEMHYSDVMALNDYNAIWATTNYPGCVINRITYANPYFGTIAYPNPMGTVPFAINDDVMAAQKNICESDLKIEPTWNEDSTTVNVKTSTTFNYNRTDAPYALGYLLMEDGLSGTGDIWAQQNDIKYFTTDNFPEADFEEFLYGEGRLQNYKFNRVPVGVYGIAKGIDASITAPLVNKVKQEYEYKIDVAPDTIIQNKKDLYVVALLFNTTTNEIVNAAKAYITSVATAIDAVTPETAVREVARYALDGRRLTSPTKGINIVKYSNGRVVKMIVK
jgi:hypothetical protein